MNVGPVTPPPARHVLLAFIALASGAAGAQAPAVQRAAPPMATPAAAPVFAIGGFRVEGENPLGEAQAQRVLAPFVRPQATMETLQQASAALETALRDAGYGLHRVALPPQDVGATVRLQIVKFTVGRVAIEGAQIHDATNVRRALPELKEGESPNFRTLAIQTAIGNENPNKQVQVSLRESEQPDRIDATIAVKEQRPWTFGVALSNAGSENTGRDRFTVSGGHTNLFNLDHAFVAAYTTSLAEPDDVRQLGLSYKVPLYAQGGVVSATFTRSDVVGNFGAFSSTGAGHTFALAYTHYLAPRGGRRSYVSVGIEDKQFDAARINDIVVPGALDRRSRPLVLGYTSRTETDAAVWGYDVALAWNTGSGSHNDLASYQSEDPRVDTVHWKALRAAASYTAPLAGDWLWSARYAFQYSPDVLISGEQFGLGGIASVRGTELERPISGDSGISTTVEITTPELAQGLRAIGFLDAGLLRNNNPNGFNKPSSDGLASVGLGLRFVRGAFEATADYGYIVKGSRVPLAVNSAAPKKGDDRFYVTVSLRF